MTLFTNTGLNQSCGVTSDTQYSITVGEGTGICCADGYKMIWWGVGGLAGAIIDALKFQFLCCLVFFDPSLSLVHLF